MQQWQDDLPSVAVGPGHDGLGTENISIAGAPSLASHNSQEWTSPAIPMLPVPGDEAPGLSLWDSDMLETQYSDTLIRPAAFTGFHIPESALLYPDAVEGMDMLLIAHPDVVPYLEEAEGGDEVGDEMEEEDENEEDELEEEDEVEELMEVDELMEEDGDENEDREDRDEVERLIDLVMNWK